MQTHRFTRAERRSLRRLAAGEACPRECIPAQHAARFAALGLIAAGDGVYGLTLKGQVEALRQHFRLFQPRVEPAIAVARTAPPDEEVFRLSVPVPRLAPPPVEPLGEPDVAA